MNKLAYVATVHLLIDASTDAEAADTVSALLTENGIYEPAAHVIDWSYTRAGGRYCHPKPVTIPADYDRDAADLAALAAIDRHLMLAVDSAASSDHR